MQGLTWQANKNTHTDTIIFLSLFYLYFIHTPFIIHSYYIYLSHALLTIQKKRHNILN
ncbi:hypothetical protein BDA99DRAFT_518521, partial [Phascolomyces articulosus]